MTPAGKRVIIGKITGGHGVTGWLKVFSYTEPRENIFLYQPWLLEKGGRENGEEGGAWTEVEFADSGKKGKILVVKFAGVEDRDSAVAFIDCGIAVYRAQLPAPPAGEYYWTDLLQMEVVSVSGKQLGKIIDIRETGANDVLIVEGKTRCSIPFVKDEIIKQVDMDNGVIKVDWQWD